MLNGSPLNDLPLNGVYARRYYIIGKASVAGAGAVPSFSASRMLHARLSTLASGEVSQLASALQYVVSPVPVHANAQTDISVVRYRTVQLNVAATGRSDVRMYIQVRAEVGASATGHVNIHDVGEFWRPINRPGTDPWVLTSQPGGDPWGSISQPSADIWTPITR